MSGVGKCSTSLEVDPFTPAGERCRAGQVLDARDDGGNVGIGPGPEKMARHQA